MRSLLGRFHRPMSRGLVNNMLTMNNLGDGSTLDLDFTTMGGVLDPRLTFSRASTATFVNSSGYVEWAGSNMVINSAFGGTSPGTGWTTNGAGSMSSSGGVFTASTTTSTTAFLSRDLNVSNGLRYSASINVTSVTGTINYNEVLTVGGTLSNTKFYRNGAEVGAAGNGSAQAQTGLITIVWTSGGTNFIRFGIGASGTNIANVTVVCDSPRAVPGEFTQPAYFASTTTAAYHAPRFDYSPTNIGEPRGLLVEGQTANLLLQSNDWNTTWNIPAPITWNGSTYATAPDGTNTAKQITVTAGASAAIGQAVTTGTNRTISVWLRGGSASLTSFSIGAFDAGGTSWGNNADSTCSIISGPGSVTQQVGGLWLITGLSATQWTRIQIFRSSTYTTFLAYPGASSGTINGTAFMWGMQMEAGSGASSYIPTGASQVTRNKDSMTLSDLSALGITNTAGTLVADFTNSTENSNYAGNLSFRSAAGSTYAARFRWATTAILTTYFQSNGSTGFTTNLNGSRTSFARCKAATSYSYDGTTTSVFGSMNGAAMSVTSTTTQAASIAIPTSLRWNDDGSTPNATDYPSMVMRSVKYYPTCLTIAQMNTLTTL